MSFARGQCDGESALSACLCVVQRRLHMHTMLVRCVSKWYQRLHAEWNLNGVQDMVEAQRARWAHKAHHKCNTDTPRPAPPRPVRHTAPQVATK